MTNKGLQIDATLVAAPRANNVWGHRSLLPLNCVRGTMIHGTHLLAPVLSTPNRDGDKLSRIECASLSTWKINDGTELPTENIPLSRTIYVEQRNSPSRIRPQCSFKINVVELANHGFNITERYIASRDLGHWAKDTKDGPVLKLSNCTALLFFRRSKENFFLKMSCVETRASFELIACRGSVASKFADLLHRRVFPPGWPEICRRDNPRGFVRSALRLTQSTVLAEFQESNSSRPLFEIELSIEESVPSVNPTQITTAGESKARKEEGIPTYTRTLI
jgi:hypothetical protein